LLREAPFAEIQEIVPALIKRGQLKKGARIRGFLRRGERARVGGKDVTLAPRITIAKELSRTQKKLTLTHELLHLKHPLLSEADIIALTKTTKRFKEVVGAKKVTKLRLKPSTKIKVGKPTPSRTLTLVQRIQEDIGLFDDVDDLIGQPKTKQIQRPKAPAPALDIQQLSRTVTKLALEPQPTRIIPKAPRVKVKITRAVTPSAFEGLGAFERTEQIAEFKEPKVLQLQIEKLLLQPARKQVQRPLSLQAQVNQQKQLDKQIQKELSKGAQLQSPLQIDAQLQKQLQRPIQAQAVFQPQLLKQILATPSVTQVPVPPSVTPIIPIIDIEKEVLQGARPRRKKKGEQDLFFIPGFTSRQLNLQVKLSTKQIDNLLKRELTGLELRQIIRRK